MNIKLRNLTIKDADFLAEISDGNEDQVAWIEKHLARPDIEMFIAEDEGKPVAWGQIDREGYVDELRWAVSPKYRNLGYGRKLAILLKELSVAPIIVATVKAENEASLKIARYIGLKEIGSDKRGYLVLRS